MKTGFITRMGELCLLLLPAIGYPLCAQASPQEQLKYAFALEKENKPALAIAELKELIETQALDAAGTGKAWNVLGLAYEDEGEFALSQKAFEESLRVLKSDADVRNHAMALNDLGGMYVATGQFDTAQKLKLQALGEYEKAGYYSGVVRASYDLAGIAFNQGKVAEGGKYLERAMKEARRADDLDEDDWAAIASLEGWRAGEDGDHAASIAKYNQALALWRKLHGEEHPDTGWGMMLLGAAEAEGGHSQEGLAEMKQGIGILGRALGDKNLRYLQVEVTYARVLDREGFHTEAKQVMASAQPALQETYRDQCIGCTVSAAAFR